MDHYGTNFNEALKKAEDIANNTSGESVVNDAFGGNTFQPLEDGVADFNKAAENIYMPKKDF